MAKYSMKVQGKEVGSAEVYAEPHNMSGQKTDVNSYNQYTPGKDIVNELNVSVGGISKGNYKPVNPYGTGVMRGGGAATKGLKISGKMG
jgi:hypothetical protein